MLGCFCSIFNADSWSQIEAQQSRIGIHSKPSRHPHRQTSRRIRQSPQKFLQPSQKCLQPSLKFLQPPPEFLHPLISFTTTSKGFATLGRRSAFGGGPHSALPPSHLRPRVLVAIKLENESYKYTACIERGPPAPLSKYFFYRARFNSCTSGFRPNRGIRNRRVLPLFLASVHESIRARQDFCPF